MKLVKSNFPTILPRVWDEFLANDLFDWGYGNKSGISTTLPAVNVVESDEGFAVEMAAPGMDKKDFEIKLNNGILTISSEKKNEEEVKEDEYYNRKEFSYQSFQRTFSLPKSVVDESNIKAQYKNGILQIWIPKKEEAKPIPPRTIKIS
jgi:HSP20 family protein